MSRERRGPGPTGFEFALVGVALFVLARVPMLFLRERIGQALGGPLSLPWQDDHIIRGAFLLVEMMVLVVAVRVCAPKSLLRQWPWIPFLGFIVISTAWSVEPGVTWRRAGMFLATALVGWYFGERFRPRQQAFVVAGVGGAAALFSVVALVFWPDLARSTEGLYGLWSGGYVHRNLLGLAMASGLLALPFVLRRLRGAALVAGFALGYLEFYLFWRSGSRTGLVALLAAGGAVLVVAALRCLRSRGVTDRGGAVAALLVAGLSGYVVHDNWTKILSWLGRNATLTSRSTIWAILRPFVDRRPLQGWGFEAFWVYQPAVAEATAGFYFVHAHSGYYEILLGVGKIGFALFVFALVITAWRLFAFAWHEPGLDGLWPLAIAVFVAVTNISESFFVSNDAQWALLVAAGVTATHAARASRHVERVVTRSSWFSCRGPGR